MQSLADQTADARHAPRALVPDLGPAAVLDQLRVLVYDAVVAGRGQGLQEALVALRRTLP
ncbi:MAG: hypothetical protein ACOYBY_11635 [Dermatophilaceae bacterium]